MSAPTPQSHVRHFLSTVDDYERMTEIYPLGERINVFGHRDDDASRWLVVLHAAMLRKYYASGDSLYLPEVVKSLRQCVIDESVYADEDWDELERTIGTVESTSIYKHGDGPSYGDGELLRHQLYGRYLHGDYEKWAETQRVGSHGSDGAVWSATRKRAIQVINLAEFIRGGVEGGYAAL